ncbi:sigma-70 family RNA polymerase sigma factor [Ekhidna sp.]|uniref:RNA polymerase sigma factor n=1 Tax=Ekhidna sp. TaxID=2608089 RepID=UPI003298B340
MSSRLKGEIFTPLSKLKSISPTDEEILSQYRATGDQELFGNLFNTHMHLVYGLCLKYLKNRDDSQDAVMAIYEHTSLKLLTTEVQHFKSWLYMVSKNHCLMELRKKNPEVHADIFMESIEAVHLNDEKIELEKDLEALEACIEELKTEQKHCVKLFFLNKKSYNQIQEETGIDLNKVKSYIQNGKRNLKMCLESKNVRR